MASTPRDFLQDELEEHLQKPGCALCRASLAGVTSYLESILYESVNDPGVRSQIVPARGFCNRHVWQMRELRGNALGLAIIYRDVLGEWQKGLSSSQTSMRDSLARLRERILGATRPHARCPGCKQQDEIDARFLSSFVKVLSDSEFQAIFRASAGLCVTHFTAVTRIADRNALEILVAIQSEIHQRLGAELSEFIRKNDYQLIKGGFGAEKDSWLRAMEHLAGTAGAVSDGMWEKHR